MPDGRHFVLIRPQSWTCDPLLTTAGLTWASIEGRPVSIPAASRRAQNARDNQKS